MSDDNGTVDVEHHTHFSNDDAFELTDKGRAVVAPDWSALEAGLDLDRLIAERQGWTNIEFRSFWYEDNDSDGWGRCLVGVLPEDDGNLDSEKTIPNYSTRTDAALTLMHDDWTAMIARIDPGEWHCSINSISSRVKDHGTGLANKPALAVCRAWLSWKDRQ